MNATQPISTPTPAHSPAALNALNAGGASTPASTPASLTAISPGTLAALLAQGRACRIVDVRSPGEFDAAHLAGSELHPLDTLNPAAWSAAASNESPLYVLCQAGGRASRAAERLSKAGVACCVVEGGLDAWAAAGLPVERKASGVLPLMRQVQIVVGLVSGTGAALGIWKHPLFGLIPLAMGAGLLFAGLTGTCGLALMMARMPWNQRSSKTSAPSAGGTASCCTPGGGVK